MSHTLKIDKNSRAAAARAEARLFTTTAMRAKVRLYYTEQPTPCADDPELFFDARAHRRAIAQCGTCPFRGRCGYNAVAVGATHGVWGGIMLPGDYPHKLAAIYTQLREQFSQRRAQELRDTNASPTAA
jgi:WhiB family transcriptional regulator, redox-sensing transcriptional regulator